MKRFPPLILCPVIIALAWASLSCERAAWPHKDAISGANQQWLPYSPDLMVHEQAYFRLRVASVSLEVAAALAFAGLLFLVTRGANSVRNSVVALLLGIVLYVCLMFLGISLMDYNVPRQRSYAVDFMILEIGCLGCLLASEALGLSSKRIPGVVTGILGLLAIAVLIFLACG